jgi:hypothetical protein
VLSVPCNMAWPRTTVSCAAKSHAVTASACLQAWLVQGQQCKGLQICIFALMIVCCCVACRHGVDVRHLWGMTELSPLGSLGTLTSGQMGDGLTHDETIALKVRLVPATTAANPSWSTCWLNFVASTLQPSSCCIRSLIFLNSCLRQPYACAPQCCPS